MDTGDDCDLNITFSGFAIRINYYKNGGCYASYEGSICIGDENFLTYEFSGVCFNTLTLREEGWVVNRITSKNKNDAMNDLFAAMDYYTDVYIKFEDLLFNIGTGGIVYGI